MNLCAQLSNTWLAFAVAVAACFKTLYLPYPAPTV